MLKKLLKKFKIDVKYLSAIAGLLLYLKNNPTAMNLALRGLGVSENLSEAKLKVGDNEFSFEGNKIIDSKGNKTMVFKKNVVLSKDTMGWDLVSILYTIGKKKGIIKWNNY